MALSANTVLEVRSTGSDTNGGGFVTGASGTDWSQQDSAQYSVTDGVTAGTTTITSATANFGADVVGNLIYVQGGTGSVTAGWYQIASRTNSTTIVVDRSTGLTAGTGVTLHIGGAFATIGAALAIMAVTGMICYVKATATYSISTGLAFPSGPTYNSFTRLIGYTTTRGDKLRPTIQATAAIVGLTMGQSGCTVENFIFDGNSTGTKGVNITGTYSNTIFNCLIHHWTAEGILDAGPSSSVIFNEVHHCAGTGGIACSGTSTPMYCYSHDNTSHGFHLSNGASAMIRDCVAANNTGGTTNGFNCVVFAGAITNCIAYGNGQDGFNVFSAGNTILQGVFNNVSVNNGRYGFNSNMNPVVFTPSFGNNAYYNNTTANLNKFVAGTGDVLLTGNPFTNAASGDFSLNSTAGAGAALKSVGLPGVALYGTGYADLNTLRHQDPAGGGGGLITNPGMAGGMGN